MKEGIYIHLGVYYNADGTSEKGVWNKDKMQNNSIIQNPDGSLSQRDSQISERIMA